MNYGREKFIVALDSLVGQGSQLDRLFYALVGSLIHLSPDRDVPESIRADFINFMDRMCSVQAVGDEGNVKATLLSMSSDEIDDAVNKVVEFHYAYFD